MTADLDNRARVHLYDRFVADRRPPTVDETSAALGVPPQDVEEAYRRLEAAHVIVLAPGTTGVWMANPLSAYPTAFQVETERGPYWGNCVWDALGIPPMLGGDGTVRTPCPDCGEPIMLRVRDGELEPTDVVCHFAVPAVRWWDNIGYT